MPRFFVPHTNNPDEADQAYRRLAELAGSPALPLAERIFEITFLHDAVEWTARVGRTLHGSRTVRRRRSGRMVDLVERKHDSATVLAIFPGNPYLVVTDGRPLGTVVSGWVNPFMAGRPLTITRFTNTVLGV